MKNIIFIAALLFFAVGLEAQHNLRFAQYESNQIQFNPAMVGASNHLKFNALYRNQWTKIDGSPESFAVGIDDAFGKRDQYGLGFYLENDNAGVDNQLNLNLAYAYKIDLGRGQLALGIQGSFLFYRSQLTELDTPDNTYDQVFREDERWTKPNIGAGLSYYQENFYVGFSIPQIIGSQKEADNVQERRYVAYNFIIGRDFEFDYDFVFKPSLYIKYIKEESPAEATLKFNFLIKRSILAGIAYRTNQWTEGEAITFQLGYHFKNGLNIGYAYDHNLLGYGDYAAGSHELMIGFRINRVREVDNNVNIPE